METFTWTPSYSSRLSHVAEVEETKFGDGFTQRVTQAINNMPLVFSLTFQKVRDTEALLIDNFVAFHRGTNGFIWNPPRPWNYQDAVAYVSALYPVSSLVSYGSNVYQCIATQETPQPVSNATYWRHVCRLPLRFTCDGVSWAPDQHDSNTITLTFKQDFNPA